MTRPHAITWFEIPVHDLARAQAFYQTLLGTPLATEQFGPEPVAVFPKAHADNVAGCLQTGAGNAPQQQGTLVYLDVAPSLDEALARVVPAGGRIVLPRTALPPGMGFFAHIVDSEGNRVGLHARE
jgi:predicted enzyme related to lactoylglutathione lyase